MDFCFEEFPSTSHGEHEVSRMSEGAGFDSSREESSTSNTTEMQEQQCHYSSSTGNISRRAQELVEKINQNRTSDQQVMDSFHEKLQEKVTEVCQKMREDMYKVYEKNSDDMQGKIQELFEVLDSCAKLNQELLEAVQALASLREGLAITQMSEP
ncbi:synaptonemal complex central element protein 2 [Nothobranchius furzeri]|nr:synaptonemal complex central element protein 2 [Nothobranchius furzeri]KAF7216446.1 transcript variant X2 [Nothobranchius furzeri]KAF7216447.1 transcript variant X1 [Nothobranchius furzeri]